MFEIFYNFVKDRVGVFGTNILIIVFMLLIGIILLFLVSKIIDKKQNNKNTNDLGLEEKHPKIHTAISCLAALALISLAIWLLRSILKWIADAFEWCVNVGSKLDVVIVVALITGTVSIVSTIFAKVFDYRKRKAEYLVKKREEPYENFLMMYYKIHDNVNNPGSYPEEEMIKDINTFSKGITMWGSKKVVNKWVQFRRMANSDGDQDIMSIIEGLLNEMRKDMGTKKVKEGILLSVTTNYSNNEEDKK